MIKEIALTVGILLSNTLGITDGDTVTVDRFEGAYTVVEVGETTHDVHTILLDFVTEGDIEEGDKLDYNEGQFEVNEEKTETQRSTIADLLNRLRNK